MYSVAGTIGCLAIVVGTPLLFVLDRLGMESMFPLPNQLQISSVVLAGLFGWCALARIHVIMNVGCRYPIRRLSVACGRRNDGLVIGFFVDDIVHTLFFHFGYRFVSLYIALSVYRIHCKMESEGRNRRNFVIALNLFFTLSLYRTF